MKKYKSRVFRVIPTICMALVMMCCLAACGNGEKENNAGVAVKETAAPQKSADETDAPADTGETDNENTPEADSDKAAEILIAYFSWSGNSKSEAELIQEKTGGTLIEIAREEPYPEDYTECTEVAKKETDDNARPSIKNPPESLDGYEKIVVCYPIWWHTAPMCVGTFLEKYDLQGKMIYPISQSASMDEDQFAESVEFIKACAKGAKVQEGLFVDADDTGAVADYVEGSILK